MEAVLDEFYAQIMDKLERDELIPAYKRTQHREYLVTVVEGLCGPWCGGDRRRASEAALAGAVAHHGRAVRDNGSVCPLGKHHDILYVMARFAVDADAGPGPVAALLNAIYTNRCVQMYIKFSSISCLPDFPPTTVTAPVPVILGQICFFLYRILNEFSNALNMMRRRNAILWNTDPFDRRPGIRMSRRARFVSTAVAYDEHAPGDTIAAAAPGNRSKQTELLSGPNAPDFS
ncbi:Hypothetical protein CINCED_3A012168, partial [Cinara cedri]